MRLDGRRIRILLLERGLRQYALARAAGISEGALSRALNGRARLRPEVVAVMAEVLGVPTAEIVEAEP